MRARDLQLIQHTCITLTEHATDVRVDPSYVSTVASTTPPSISHADGMSRRACNFTASALYAHLPLVPSSIGGRAMQCSSGLDNYFHDTNAPPNDTPGQAA